MTRSGCDDRALDHSSGVGGECEMDGGSSPGAAGDVEAAGAEFSSGDESTGGQDGNGE
jgi:hypothetical protein